MVRYLHAAWLVARFWAGLAVIVAFAGLVNHFLPPWLVFALIGSLLFFCCVLLVVDE